MNTTKPTSLQQSLICPKNWRASLPQWDNRYKTYLLLGIGACFSLYLAGCDLKMVPAPIPCATHQDCKKKQGDRWFCSVSGFCFEFEPPAASPDHPNLNKPCNDHQDCATPLLRCRDNLCQPPDCYLHVQCVEPLKAKGFPAEDYQKAQCDAENGLCQIVKPTPRENTMTKEATAPPPSKEEPHNQPTQPCVCP